MKTHSVLFVDDQQEILNAIKNMFNKEDFEQYYALETNEALRILENFRVDVVLTDMSMPGLGGIELLDILKIKYPQVVRIVLSGHSDVSTILNSINRGEIFRYITKPWKIDQDAKNIILDAFNYSDYLRQTREVQSNDNLIEIDKIINIFEILDINYFSLSDKKISNVSDEKFLKAKELDLNEFIKIHLNSSNTVYIEKSKIIKKVLI